MKNVVPSTITKATILGAAAIAILAVIGITAAPAAAENTIEPRNPVAVSSSEHLKFAENAMNSGEHEVALRYLQLAQVSDPGNLDILDAFLKAARQSIVANLAKDDHSRAQEIADWTSSLFSAMEESLLNGELAQLAELYKREPMVREVSAQISQDIVEKSHGRILAACASAEEAHCWYWRNDRDKVREGLRTLRWVQDRYDWLNPDTRGDFHHALSKLKGRVSDKEWNDLLASAGFQARQDS